MHRTFERLGQMKNALDFMVEKFGPSSHVGRGMFPPQVGLMGATERYGAEPSTYTEYVASVMASDPAIGGMSHEERMKRVEKKPFDYVVSLWLRGGSVSEHMFSGLSELRDEWLRYMISNDADLDDTEKENYLASLKMYYNDTFGGVHRVSLSAFERAFWKKPGHSEIWKLSVALALPAWLSKTVGGLENATFLEVDVPKKEELEELTGEW